MINTRGTDSLHFSFSEDGELLVDPKYAGENPAWFGLMKAAAEAGEIARIGKTPYGAVTSKQRAMWEHHILTKVATEPDGTHLLEIVARWLQQFADQMSAPIRGDDA